jgi:hypothetical protein
MSRTTFDLNTPIGQMHLFLYFDHNDSLVASVQDEMSRHPNFVSNPPEGIIPVVVNRIPVTVSYSLNADPNADLTDPESWRFGQCWSTRLDGPTYSHNDATYNQMEKIRHTVKDTITTFFTDTPDLVYDVIATSQESRVEDLRQQVTKAEKALTELRERMDAEEGRLLDMTMMRDPYEGVGEDDRKAFVDERNKVFGLGVEK